MSQQTLDRANDDNLIEQWFVKDYGEFALQMNLLAITALLEKARSVSDTVKRKSICLSGLQLLYSSYEDHAIVLHAFRNRITGKHLHLTIGVEDQSRIGSTAMPRILKHYESVRQLFDNLGFTLVTHERLSQYRGITEEQLEERYRDIANSIKILGEYQEEFNDYKNKLKHGKPVLEGARNRNNPDDVLFLRWGEQDGKPVLESHWMNASLEQLEIATIQVAKIFISSLEFLWLFMLQYYPEHADKFLHETMSKCRRECVEQVCALGLESEGF